MNIIQKLCRNYVNLLTRHGFTERNWIVCCIISYCSNELNNSITFIGHHYSYIEASIWCDYKLSNSFFFLFRLTDSLTWNPKHLLTQIYLEPSISRSFTCMIERKIDLIELVEVKCNPFKFKLELMPSNRWIVRFS